MARLVASPTKNFISGTVFGFQSTNLTDHVVRVIRILCILIFVRSDYDLYICDQVQRSDAQRLCTAYVEAQRYIMG